MSEGIHLVFGAKGFVGSALCARLRAAGGAVVEVDRSMSAIHGEIGTIYYCAGVTGDFLADPANTIDANCGFLARSLKDLRFRSLVYLSSARLNLGETEPNAASPVKIAPWNPDHLYNASKALGELVAQIVSEREGAAVHIVRLSNVLGYDPGSPNFFWELARAAQAGGPIQLRTTLHSTRDYVALDDVVAFLAELSGCANSGTHYAASGNPVSTADILEILGRHAEFEVEIEDGAKTISAPRYPNDSFRALLGREPANPRETLKALASHFYTETGAPTV